MIKEQSITDAETKSSNKRNPIIDIMKGIGIFFVVVGHCGIPIGLFIYTFHMALFFMLSGYCLSSKYSASPSGWYKLIKNKFFRLYIPFVCISIIFNLLHNYFMDINLITDNPQFLTGYLGNFFGLNQRYSDILAVIKNTLLFEPQEHVLGPTWFLSALFSALVLYAGVKLILIKTCPENFNTALILLALLFSSIGFKHTGNRSFMCIYIACTVFPLFIFTDYIKSKYSLSIGSKNAKNFILYSVLSCVSVFIILFLKKDLNFAIDLGVNSINSPTLFILESIIGFFFTYFLACLLTYIKTLANIFMFMGKYTLSILILHLSAFKIVTYIQVLIYKLPEYRLSSFPVYDVSHGWWILYCLVGIVIPIACAVIFDYIKNGICRLLPKKTA